MMSLAARSGAFSPYMQATSFTVAGPLKALVPGVVVKGEKILLNPKKKFLCRESLNGQSPKTGPAVTVSINGKSVIDCRCQLSVVLTRVVKLNIKHNVPSVYTKSDVVLHLSQVTD